MKNNKLNLKNTQEIGFLITFKLNITSTFLLLFIYVTTTLSAQEQNIPAVEKLLEKMTLEEKIGQLNLVTPGGNILTGSVVSKDVEQKIKNGQVGGIFGIATPSRVRQAQQLAVDSSSVGIPLLIGADIIHGYKTIFPIPLGMAATWNLELIEKSASLAAKEATADGINWNFSPMVDISRDPRWGRVAEGAGEDAYLGSKIAEAFVKGYQGNNLKDANTMMATVKHFALYGAVEAGRDYNTVDMSPIRMYNEYLPPYQAAIDAGAGSVMTSFNDINGIPATGNKWLLTELLRNQWGFEGFVVSDYTAVLELVKHGVGSIEEASALALNAGLDMDMVGVTFLKQLEKNFINKQVSEEQITNAARRVLNAKYKLGLLEDPFKYNKVSNTDEIILTDENRKLAKKVAAESFVLLKNEHQTLTLSYKKKIAFIGPFVNDQFNMLGTWAPTGDYRKSVSILKALENYSEEIEFSYAKGANITNDTVLAKKVNVFGTRIEMSKRTPEQLLLEAKEKAKLADVIVLTLGEATEMSGESSNRTNLDLPESQKKLLNELKKLKKPIILVLFSGRPLTISEELSSADAVLVVWHPGVEAGNAIVESLFGDYNPSGKLTSTWPRNVGQIPVYYNHKNTGRPQKDDNFEKFKTNYLDVENTPLLPFGFGLSYSSFEISNVKTNKPNYNTNETVSITANVKNTGEYDGAVTVQLYTHQKYRSITPPVKELKGFKKIHLNKGENKEVKFLLTKANLSYLDDKGQPIFEAGEFYFDILLNAEKKLENSFWMEELKED